MRLTIIVLLFISYVTVSGQKGENTYEFLNLPNSAHTGALGGVNVSLFDNDPSVSNNNPALLRDTMHNHVSANYINYVSDINFGYVSYARNFGDIGVFALGVQYINDGEFDGYNEFGEFTGNFTSQETALSLIYSTRLSQRWRFGAAFKQIFSSFEQYSSYGIAFDAGLSYMKNNFSAGLNFKNFGTQIKTYTQDNFEGMPFVIQAGFTQKLNHAPFRFSLTANHIQMPDITYRSGINKYPNSLSGNAESTSVGGKILRHVIAGVEFVPSKNFYVAAGYNFQRRNELGIAEKMSNVGFSWGFGMRIKKFHISYGSARYHLAGTSNHISVVTNLSAF